MKSLFGGLLSAALLLIVSCQPAQPVPTRIQWDEWGVPHIEADTEEELFFAQGWAQMNNHANRILELYGTSRGRAAEYWGVQGLETDMLVHTLGFEELYEEWKEKQDPKTKLIYESFVKGMNAWAEAHPDQIDEDKKAILPLSAKDVHMHSMYVVFTRFVGGYELERTQQWSDMGSNAYAISTERSASGNTMLVQNPHLPWGGEFTWFESHLMLKDRNFYGAMLVGFPGIAIGFNEYLGWSHTDNTIDNADLYELELSGQGYLMDGEEKAFGLSSKSIKVKQADGGLRDQEIQVFHTEHGPVVKKGNSKVLALRMAGNDSPNMFLQWWTMMNSTNLEEFESALQMAQIPFWNVMYADKHGDIFYLFNGLIPKRSQGDWAYWNRVVPGGKSEDIWTEFHSYAELPKLKNPETGWLQNANDPPWSSTIPQLLDPADYPGYVAPVHMYLRPQRSARMLMEDDTITFEELVDYKLSTRIEFADRILDDLQKAVNKYPSEKANQALAVLNDWDRESDAESKGMLLFYNWSRKFQVWNHRNFTEGWDPENPVSTPDGIADEQRAVNLLEEAADELLAKYGRLDVPWGDYYRIVWGERNLPANGIDGSLGVFRVVWAGGGNADNLFAGGGDSWVGVIEFGERPKAKVLLSYGNASQADSPHNGDQLELFSRKEMRDAWFTREQLEGHVVRSILLDSLMK